MRNLALFFLLAGLSLLGSSHCLAGGHSTGRPLPEGTPATEPAAPLPHFAASVAQVKAAPCRRGVPTAKEIETDLGNETLGGPRVSIVVQGVRLDEESPRLIAAFKDLITTEPGIGPENQQKTVKGIDQINPACHKVLCAVKKLFGERLGPKLLYLRARYGFNGSEYAFQDTSAFTEEELDRVLAALSDYPEAVFPITRNHRLAKFPANWSGGNTYANASIGLFPLWSRIPEAALKEYTVFHELGHVIAAEMELDEDPQWLKLSGWVRKSHAWEASRKSSFVSGYAATNPAEDFAETVCAYRYNPGKLKEVNPGKYRFLKELVFQGLEYTGAAACQPERSFFTVARTAIEARAKHFDPSPFESDRYFLQSISRCPEEWISDLTDEPGAREALGRCLSTNVLRDAELGELEKSPDPIHYLTLLRDRGRASPLGSTSAIPDGKKEEIESALRARMRERLLDALTKHEEDQTFFYRVYEKPTSSLDPQKFCEAWVGRFPYQILRALEPRFKLALYEHDRDFGDYFRKLCTRIQSSLRIRAPMSRELFGRFLSSESSSLARDHAEKIGHFDPTSFLEKTTNLDTLARVCRTSEIDFILGRNGLEREVENCLETLILGAPFNLNEEASRLLSQKAKPVIATVENLLRKGLVAALMRQEEDSKTLYENPDQSAEAFCKGWAGDYPYMVLRDAVPTEGFKGEFFERREEIKARFQAVCLKIQSALSKRKPMSKADFESALK